jgi:hypothetical protein
MKKIGVAFVTLVMMFVSGSVFCTTQENDISDPSIFIGNWVAVEYFNTSNIQAIDADKHLGNTIYLKSDSYYSDYFDSLPAQSVAEYCIEERNNEDFYIHYKISLNELGIMEDHALVLYTTETRSCSERKYDVGIIIDMNTLICNTGTGWYLYKREHA